MIKFNTLVLIFMIKISALLLIFIPLNAFGNESPHLNDTLPDFSLKDINGSIHTLYEYRGKFVMLFTIGHGWGYCHKRAPRLEAVYKKYRNHGFEIIGLDGWDGTIEQVKNFIKKTKVTFPILLEVSSYIKKLGTIDNRGAFFLIDREGVVIASCDDGYKSLDCFEPTKLDSIVSYYLSKPQEKEKWSNNLSIFAHKLSLRIATEQAQIQIQILCKLVSPIKGWGTILI